MLKVFDVKCHNHFGFSVKCCLQHKLIVWIPR